jgi:hypothetical protein
VLVKFREHFLIDLAVRGGLRGRQGAQAGERKHGRELVQVTH